MSKVLDITRGAGFIPTLTLLAYADANTALDIVAGPISIPYDPETFEIDSALEVQAPKAMAEAPGTRYAASGDTTVTVDLLFDDTTVGDVISYAVKTAMPYDIMVSDSVEAQLAKFVEIAYTQQDDKGNPPYVGITSSAMPIWTNPSGEFRCMLRELKITTNLVSVFTGQRLKVTAHCQFSNIDDE